MKTQAILWNQEGGLSFKRALKAHVASSSRVRVAVGFLLNSGAKTLLKLCRRSGVPTTAITVVTGLSFEITEPSAVTVLMTAGIEVRFYDGDGVFHPKVYAVEKKGLLHLIIGSANLSGLALDTNVECGVSLRLKENERVARSFEAFWSFLMKNSKTVSPEAVVSYARRRKPRPYAEPRSTRGRDQAASGRRSSPIARELRLRRIVKSRPRRLRFRGRSFVLTGGFEYGTQADCADQIRRRGGIVVARVSRTTDVLVVGTKGSWSWLFEKYGRKIEKASELGVEIVDEGTWRRSL